MLHAFKKTAARAALNTLLQSQNLLDVINTRASRYATVHRIRQTEQGFETDVSLAGSTEIITVAFTELYLAADCSSITLSGFSASRLWLQHLLEDFVADTPLSISEKYRPLLKPLRVTLLAASNPAGA